MVFSHDTFLIRFCEIHCPKLLGGQDGLDFLPTWLWSSLSLNFAVFKLNDQVFSAISQLFPHCYMNYLFLLLQMSLFYWIGILLPGNALQGIGLCTDWYTMDAFLSYSWQDRLIFRWGVWERGWMMAPRYFFGLSRGRTERRWTEEQTEMQEGWDWEFGFRHVNFK